jgi:DNA modification methylase
MILDPFSGSGTTNLEALLLNRNSVGIDVDPFSRFISTVKVTPLAEKELIETQESLLSAVEDYQPTLVSESDIPFFPYRDNWFNREIILELAYLKKAIESLDRSERVKDFFKVCFSSIIRSVSNADDNCTRTVIRKVLNKQVNPSDALRKFVETVLVKVPKMIEFSQNVPQGVTVSFPENMDARNIKYDAGTFDLVLTSPPYANAVDYPRTHQLELYWLGFADGTLTPLKKKHVGTESVSSQDYRIRHQIGVEAADSVIEKIFEKDPRRAYIAFKYLNDMRKNLAEVYSVLRDGGRYIIVVGNNRMRGQLFESWKYLMTLAENIGFDVENYFGSEIIKHFIKVPREERINTDWILVLRK